MNNTINGLFKQKFTIVCLTIISVSSIFMGKGCVIELWFLYGLYKLFTI